MAAARRLRRLRRTTLLGLTRRRLRRLRRTTLLGLTRRRLRRLRRTTLLGLTRRRLRRLRRTTLLGLTRRRLRRLRRTTLLGLTRRRLRRLRRTTLLGLTRRRLRRLRRTTLLGLARRRLERGALLGPPLLGSHATGLLGRGALSRLPLEQGRLGRLPLGLALGRVGPVPRRGLLGEALRLGQPLGLLRRIVGGTSWGALVGPVRWCRPRRGRDVGGGVRGRRELLLDPTPRCAAVALGPLRLLAPLLVRTPRRPLPGLGLGPTAQLGLRAPSLLDPRRRHHHDGGLVGRCGARRHRRGRGQGAATRGAVPSTTSIPGRDGPWGCVPRSTRTQPPTPSTSTTRPPSTDESRATRPSRTTATRATIALRSLVTSLPWSDRLCCGQPYAPHRRAAGACTARAPRDRSGEASI